MNKRVIDITGKRYGRLVVQRLADIVPYPKPPKKTLTRVYRWLCKCDCGNETIVASQRLRRGATRSCGCLYREVVGVSNRTHGCSQHSAEYRIWTHIKGRCLNPKDRSYYRYGGRGISIDPRWASDFEAFLTDVGIRPSVCHSLDRVDNNGNYEPGNVRWATAKTQQNNRRNNVNLTIDGETKTLTQWANEYGLNPKLVRSRIVCLGWPAKKALSSPIRWRGQNAGFDSAKYVRCSQRNLELLGD